MAKPKHKKSKLNFVRLMQDNLAELAVGPSTLRNQGSKGVVESARQYLKKVDFRKFTRNVSTERQFKVLLNRETERLQSFLPKGARNWGAARKVLNIFLRQAFCNHFLHAYYRLGKLEYLLEVPLDRNVADGILAHPLGASLPKWKSIKELSSHQSELYQDVAGKIAKEEGIARAHMEMIWWRSKK